MPDLGNKGQGFLERIGGLNGRAFEVDWNRPSASLLNFNRIWAAPCAVQRPMRQGDQWCRVSITGRQENADGGTAVASGAAVVAIAGKQSNADVGIATAVGLTIYELTVSDSYIANVADQDTGVDTGEIAAQWKDGDVSFVDTSDTVWHTHVDESVIYTLVVSDSYHINAGQDTEAGYITGADPVWQDTTDATFKDEDVIWETHGSAVTSDGSVSVTGHQAESDLGPAVIRGVGLVVAVGHIIEADSGDGLVTGAAEYAVSGHALGADNGTAETQATAVVNVSGDESASDVGTASVIGLSLYDITVEDSYSANVGDAPSLSQDGVVDGTATVAGIEAQAENGTVTATGTGAVVYRRRRAGYVPAAEKEKPKEKPTINASVEVVGVRAVAAAGAARITGAAVVIPFVLKNTGIAGNAVAYVDYTLRDQQEEEFIQILLAA
jgi:hypothetical protein